MPGRTTLTHGIITPHTASEAHGTGAATMIRGTATPGTGADGTAHITMADGTIHTTTEDGMIHGITAAGMTHGTTAAGMTHGTTADITEAIMAATTDGILIGDTTITTIILQYLSITKTVGMETAGKQVPTECSQAESRQEEA